VDVAMRGVLSFTVLGNISLPPGEATDGVEILEIDDLLTAHLLDRVHELHFGFSAEAAIRHVDGTGVAVFLLVNFGFVLVECLEFIAEGEHILGIPAFGFPGVEVDALGAGVHHEVDGAAAAEAAAHGNDGLAAAEVLRWLGFVEESGFGVGGKMAEIEGWVVDCWILILVGAALDEEDLQVWVVFGETAGGDTGCCSSTGEDDIHLAHVGGVFDRHNCGGIDTVL
jgi:hypothetical protein